MMSFICALPILASLFAACGGAGPLAVGYVEGEYVLVAPIETAQVVDLAVRRGDRVANGQALVRLERRDAEIAVAQAAAGLAQAQRQLANLQEGRRPEEIASIVASLRSAKAQAAEAERVLQRQSDLLEQGFPPRRPMILPPQRSSSTRPRSANSKPTWRSPGCRRAKTRSRPRRPRSTRPLRFSSPPNGGFPSGCCLVPLSGVVSDIIRNAGEVAGPQAPVLSVLPDGAVKLKVYVPETALSSIRVGETLVVRCDGCGDGMRATVSYVSPDPEFTPPVIYSLENRQKLVYLVEARPDADAAALMPGQIVDVDLEGAGNERHRGPRAGQAFRGQDRCERCLDVGGRRRDLGVPGAERIRQDNHDPRHVRAADAGRGRGEGAWA
jgi:HlyD family secretion protein